MEVSEVRRRGRAAIEAARRHAQERRGRADQAARDYEAFLQERATPVFHAFASALTAEGHRFSVSTPAQAVRLVSHASPEDYIELTLDTTSDPPAVLGRTSRGRGRRLVTAERPLTGRGTIAELSEEDVLTFLATEIAGFVER